VPPGALKLSGFAFSAIADTCSMGADHSGGLSFPSPAAISPSSLLRALSPLITVFFVMETTGEEPDRFQTCPQQNCFHFIPWEKDGGKMGKQGQKCRCTTIDSYTKSK